MLHIGEQLIAARNDGSRHAGALGNQAHERVHEVANAFDLGRGRMMRATDEGKLIGRTIASALDGDESGVNIRLGKLLGSACTTEIVNGLGRTLNQGHQNLVRHDPLTRNVATLGTALSPRRELAGDGELSTRARVDALDALEGKAVVDNVVLNICKRAHLIGHPRHAAKLPKPIHNDPVCHNEVAHIVHGILELQITQRTTRPIGQRLGFW